MKENSYNTSVFIALLLCVAIGFSELVFAESPVPENGKNDSRTAILERVRKEGRNGWDLVKTDTDSQTKTVLYSTSGDIGRNIAWSYDGSYLAFLVSGTLTDAHGGDADSSQHLVVVTPEGKPVKVVPNVRYYRWSPSKSEIAVLIGSQIEGGLEFDPTKTCTIDISTGEEIEIPVLAYDLYWASHDNRIYFYVLHNPVVVFDPEDRTTTATPYHGIYFSPDGSYYYCPSMEGSPFYLYRTENNELVKSSNPILQKEILFPEGWLEGTNCLVVWDYKRKVADIINVETGKSCEVNVKPSGQKGAIISRRHWHGSDVVVTNEMINALK